MTTHIARAPVGAFLHGLIVPWAGAGAVIAALSRAPGSVGDLWFFVGWAPLLVLSSGALAAYTGLPATRFVPVAAFGALVALVGVPLVSGGGGPIWAALCLFGVVLTAVGAVGAQLLFDQDGGFRRGRFRSYFGTAAVVGVASLGILAVGEVSAPSAYSPGVRRALATGLLVAAPVAGFATVRYAGVPARTLLSGIVLFPFLAILLDYESVGLAAAMAGLVAAGVLTVSVGRGLGRW